MKKVNQLSKTEMKKIKGGVVAPSSSGGCFLECFQDEGYHLGSVTLTGIDECVAGDEGFNAYVCAYYYDEFQGGSGTFECHCF